MQESMLLCLGSTLSALVGLLLLGWGARGERWRWLWVLVAAALLIAAGFGAAETVYQIAVEHEEERGPEGTPVSKALVLPSPAPATAWRSPTAVPLPSPTGTSPPSPSPPPSATPTTPPTIEPLPSPTLPPTVSPPGPLAEELGDVGALAPSLIAAEREILATLDDPPHYILDVTVDFDALTVAGTAEIRYTNNERQNLDAVYLRLYPNAAYYEEGSTQIEALTVDGDTAAFTFEDADRTILKVPLPSALKPEERTTLLVTFSVTVPRRSDRFGYAEGVMSLGHWYPMLAVYDDEGWNLDPYVALGDAFYSDVGFYTVDLSVPEGTVVAATGVKAGEVLHRSPGATALYVSAATRDFALALSRDYETASAQIGDTTVTSYYLPGDESSGQQALQVAADALEVYSGRFGRYPYTELDVAETSFEVMGAPGGMEFPGIVFIGSGLYESGGLFGSELDVVVAHEVAHQWWYGVVGNNQVDEPWLDEGFATYSSILYAEDKLDPLRAEAILWSQALMPYQVVRLLGADGPLQSSLLDYSDDLITYQSLVYGKGALFLARLRELLGDEPFFALLQQHYQTHKYALLPPDGFRQSLEAAAGEGEALALYDAVVVRGEPLEELSALEGLAGLEGLLQGDLSLEELDALQQLLEELLQGMEP
jgi:hypothetical protein